MLSAAIAWLWLFFSCDHCSPSALAKWSSTVAGVMMLSGELSRATTLRYGFTLGDGCVLESVVLVLVRGAGAGASVGATDCARVCVAGGVLCVCVCVCEREREYVCESVCERVCVCV